MTAEELIVLAAKNGLHARFDAGLVVVTRSDGNHNFQMDIVKQLGDQIENVHAVLCRRAAASRAKTLLGARVWMREFGAGELTDCSDFGGATITVEEKLPLRQMAENLLVIEEEKKTESSSLQSQETPQPPRKRMFGLWS